MMEGMAAMVVGASAAGTTPTPALTGAHPIDGHTALMAAPASASASASVGPAVGTEDAAEAVVEGMAAIAVATSSAAARGASPAEPPPTMLQRREWQRGAQRAVRLALTATRSAWTDFQAASDAGHKALTELADALLLLVTLPGLPLGALADVPGILQAAGGKLALRHAGALATLQDSVAATEVAASAVEGAAASVSAVAFAAPGSDCGAGVGGGGTGAAGQLLAFGGAVGGGWRCAEPVFATIAAPLAAELLHEVSAMLTREAQLRASIVDALTPTPQQQSMQRAVAHGDDDNDGAGSRGAGGGDSGGGGDGAPAGVCAAGAVLAPTLAALGCSSPLLPGGAGACVAASARSMRPGQGGRATSAPSEAEVRDALTVLLSSWLSCPYIHTARLTEVVEGLAEDMVGF
ncbi:hypothetical protein FOA52_016308 [Chlamydomonas sp. UWO 241]|nr:hypothetical protein FOA52_016308 [Chlamydomonas sp. UWO 241]